MLGEKKRVSKKLFFPNTIAFLLVFALVVIVAKSQVSIVPVKPRSAPRSAPPVKTKKSLRPKPRVAPTPRPEPAAEASQETQAPSQESQPGATTNANNANPDPQVNLPKNIFVLRSSVPAKPTPTPEKTDVAVSRPPATENGAASGDKKPGTAPGAAPVAASAKAE